MLMTKKIIDMEKHKSTITLGLRKIPFCFLILFCFANFSYSQTYIQVNITQPALLLANAGNDTTIVLGDSIILGGTPAASGGTTGYSYSWAPSTWLNNDTLANPTAIPNDTILYTLFVTDANGCADSNSIKVNVTNAVSLENLSDDNLIKIFPNPSHGKIEIELSDINTSFNLTISNNSGQIIFYKQYEKGLLKNKNIIDLTDAAKGDYYLRIKNATLDITKKIILN